MSVYIPFENYKYVGGPSSFLKHLKTYLDKVKYPLAKDLKSANTIFFPIQHDHNKLFEFVKKGGKIIQRLDTAYYPSFYGANYIELNKPIKNIYDNFSDHIVFQSEYSRKQCFEIFGEIDSTSYSIIRNGTDTCIFYPDKKKVDLSDEVIFVTSGSIRFVEMVEPILKALDLLSKEIKLKLKIIGPVDEKIKKTLSRDYVIFVGSLGSDPMADIYRKSDVYLHCHLNDNCPNSVIEAISCGLPVAGYKTGGVPELLNFNSELLAYVSEDLFQEYKDFDHMKLYDKIKILISDYKLFKHKSLLHSSEYSIEKCGAEYLQIFNKIEGANNSNRCIHKMSELNKLGIESVNNGFIEDAILLFLRANDIYSYDFDNNYNLGTVYYKSEDFVNSLKYYLEAYKIQPNEFDVVCNIVSLLKDTGRKEIALQIIDNYFRNNAPKRLLSNLGNELAGYQKYIIEETNLADADYWNAHYMELELSEANDQERISVWLNKHIPRNNGKCLEIGAYPGRYLTVLGRLGYELNGIDFASNINALPIWLKSKGYRVGSFYQMDFFNYETTEKYDVVCSFGFIEHFTNWETVLYKHAALVADQGYLVIETPNFKGDLQKFLHQELDFDNYKRHNIEAMDPRLWEQILKNLGYEIVFSGYFGGFNFWVEQDQLRSDKENDTLEKLNSILPLLRKITTDNESYSPYCGLIAKKRKFTIKQHVPGENQNSLGTCYELFDNITDNESSLKFISYIKKCMLHNKFYEFLIELNLDYNLKLIIQALVMYCNKDITGAVSLLEKVLLSGFSNERITKLVLCIKDGK